MPATSKPNQKETYTFGFIKGRGNSDHDDDAELLLQSSDIHLFSQITVTSTLSTPRFRTIKINIESMKRLQNLSYRAQASSLRCLKLPNMTIEDYCS